MSNPADFTNRLQTYLNKQLLKSLDYNLVLAGYGQRKAYPSNGLTIRFFRPRAANTTGVGTISEGSVPANKTEVAVGYVDVTLAQRGAYAQISDLTLAVDLVDTMQLYTKKLGEDAALDLDTVIRNAIVAGLKTRSDSAYTAAAGYFERFAGVTVTATVGDDFTSLYNATAANSKITRAIHLGCVTQLKQKRVPMIGGKYVAIVPPATLHDMRQDTTWTGAAMYSDPENLYKRGQLMVDGCVFVEADNPFTENGTRGTYASGGVIYSNLYLGADSFGVPEHTKKDAGASQYSPQIIMVTKPDSNNPLATYVTAGWKALWGCALLLTNVADDVPHCLNLRTKSTFI